MKIKIEIDESAAEDEVIIRCRGLTKQVAAVQRAVRDVTNASEKILLYKGNTEYYVTLSKILFLIVTLFIGFVISLALFVTILLPFWRNFVTVHKI